MELQQSCTKLSLHKFDQLQSTAGQHPVRTVYISRRLYERRNMYRQYYRCDSCYEYACKNRHICIRVIMRNTIRNVMDATMPHPIPPNQHDNCEVKSYQQNFLKVSFIKRVRYFSSISLLRFFGFPALANIAPINHDWQ